MSAGGVHFIGSTIDRVFRAFDVATGEMLWDDSLSADAKAAPLSYELTQTRLHPGDRQYTNRLWAAQTVFHDQSLLLFQ
jgi:glucose dehydrogenase